MNLLKIERAYYRIRIWSVRCKIVLVPLLILVGLFFMCAAFSGKNLTDFSSWVLVGMDKNNEHITFDVVAAFSAVVMCASAWLASSLYEGNIINEHYKVYSQPSMADNLRRLIKLRNKHYDDFRIHRTPFDTCLQGLDAYHSQNFSWGDKEDGARRNLKFYFYNAVDMYVSGRISFASFRRLVDQSAICVFFDVVEPMECMINPIYGARRYHMIMLFAGDIYLKHKMYDAAINNRRFSGSCINPGCPNGGSCASMVTPPAVTPPVAVVSATAPSAANSATSGNV